MFGFTGQAKASQPAAKDEGQTQPAAGGDGVQTTPTPESAAGQSDANVAGPEAQPAAGPAPAQPSGAAAGPVGGAVGVVGGAAGAANELPKAGVYNVYSKEGQLKRSFTANEYGTSEIARKSALEYAEPRGYDVRPG